MDPERYNRDNLRGGSLRPPLQATTCSTQLQAGETCRGGVAARGGVVSSEEWARPGPARPSPARLAQRRTKRFDSSRRGKHKSSNFLTKNSALVTSRWAAEDRSSREANTPLYVIHTCCWQRAARRIYIPHPTSCGSLRAPRLNVFLNEDN